MRGTVLILILSFTPHLHAAEAKTFIALHAGGYLLGMADTTATARTQSQFGASEGNPLAPQNPSLRAAEVTASWAALTWFDRRLEKRGNRYWWVGPAVAIAGHSWGLYTGVRAPQPQPAVPALDPIRFRF